MDQKANRSGCNGAAGGADRGVRHPHSTPNRNATQLPNLSWTTTRTRPVAEARVVSLYGLRAHLTDYLYNLAGLREDDIEIEGMQDALHAFEMALERFNANGDSAPAVAIMRHIRDLQGECAPSVVEFGMMRVEA